MQLQLTQKKAHRKGKTNVRPVATGNWGCGKSANGDVQLKLVIQWMAASVAGLPEMLYYTAGNDKLTKVINCNFVCLLFNECVLKNYVLVGHCMSSAFRQKLDRWRVSVSNVSSC